ncbi:MAG: hypothetical protein LUC88_04545 [Prevotella sp.]|nr:hypothetical protein [Prevotella sp.]
MGKCTDQETLYEDIEFCQGKKSLPGLRNHVYGISKRDILSWPTIVRSKKTSLGTIAVYDGDFELAADKKWHKLDLIPDENQIQVENQGTYGSKTFKVTGTFLLPGTEEEASGYIADANNDDMVYLAPQRNGKYRMVGCEAFSVELSLAQDSGKAATDTNSTTITATATDENPAPFYTGKIETEDGDISGADGTAITE